MRFKEKRNMKVYAGNDQNYNFDRGLDVAPVDENTQLAIQLLLHSENY